MDYRDLIKQIFENGRNTFSDMEAYLVRDSEKTIEYSNENLEKYALASSGGLALTVRQGDRIGAAYTENLTVEAIPELLSMAEQTCLLMSRRRRVCLIYLRQTKLLT